MVQNEAGINNIKASVLIFFYDRTKFLKNAIDSVLESIGDRKDIEIILSGCLKEEEIGFPLPKINFTFKKFELESDYGIRVSEALKASKGELIFYLEDDDIFLPDKIERIITQFDLIDDLKVYKDTPVIVNSDEYLDPQLISITIKKESRGISNLEYKIHEISYTDFIELGKREGFINPSTMVFRKSVLLDNLDLILCSQPIDILLSGAFLNNEGTYRLSTQPLTAYRFHSDNASALNNIHDFDKALERFRDIHTKFYIGLKKANEIKRIRKSASLYITNSKFYYHSFLHLIIGEVWDRSEMIKVVIRDFLYEIKSFLLMANEREKGSYPIMNRIQITVFVKELFKKVKGRIPLLLIYLINKELAKRRLITYLLNRHLLN